MANVAVFGIGYVGLVTGVALATQGHRVLCVDVDPARVEAVTRGVPPFHERGLAEALASVRASGALDATLDASRAVRESGFSFLCVGTPGREGGAMDDSALRSAARTVGAGLRGREGPHLVVVKSTVLPGTTEGVVVPELERARGGDLGRIGVCVNPEFLREGSALSDALEPDRVVVGERDPESGTALLGLLGDPGCPTLRCGLRTAEMIKYATNAFLATKISFANELANLCEGFGVDVDAVVRGMGLDPRINPSFMVPGVGFGGSCLPKDARALLAAARGKGGEPLLLAAALAVNDRQPLRAVEILEGEVGPLAGKRVAVLGLAFKAGTDDVRESRALPICEELLRRGAQVVGYDPVASGNFARLAPRVAIAGEVREALRGAHGCILQADWDEFRALRREDFRGMAKPVVVDGRRTLDPATLGDGVVYRRIG